jgi:phage-related minor tail protein
MHQILHSQLLQQHEVDAPGLLLKQMAVLVLAVMLVFLAAQSALVQRVRETTVLTAAAAVTAAKQLSAVAEAGLVRQQGMRGVTALLGLMVLLAAVAEAEHILFKHIAPVLDRSSTASPGVQVAVDRVMGTTTAAQTFKLPQTVQ